VVCVNTLAAAHNNKDSQLIRIRHTRSSKVNLENVRDIMDNINVQFEATAEQYRFLASKDFNQNDIQKYVKVMLGIDKTPEEDIKTRTRNIMDEILALVEGPHQSAAGVRGTWWAAYTGYNDYLNFINGRTVSNRLDSLWFGQNGSDNLKALNTAVDFANAV